MKKINYLLSLLVLLFSVSACNNSDELISNVELSVNAYIGTANSRAEKSDWVENDQLGVYVCNETIDKPYQNNTERYSNVLFRHNGKGFVAEKIYLDENLAEIFAYWPYAASGTPGTAIPVESASQTDYLYGHADTPASISQKNVNIEMKHALSQIVFRIKVAAEYNEGPAALTSLKIENSDATNVFRTAGTLNLSTGVVTGTSNMGILTLMPGQTLNLTADYQTVSAICLPVQPSPGKNIRAVFSIDGKSLKFDFPAGTAWAASTRNIYTLTVTNSGLEIGGGGTGTGDGSDDGITIEPWGTNSNGDISLVPII